MNDGPDYLSAQSKSKEVTSGRGLDDPLAARIEVLEVRRVDRAR